MERHLAGAAGGALGGLVGTALMQQGFAVSGSLPESLQPPATAEDPGEFMLRSVERAAGRALPLRVHTAAAQGLHWAYGTTCATVLGAALPALGVRTWRGAVLAGVGLGTAVWAVGFLGWMPAVGLVAPIHRQGASHVAVAVISHLVYGVAATLPMFALYRRLARPRRRW